jgi:hypothetical protein
MKVLDMTAIAISHGLISGIGCALERLAISQYRNNVRRGRVGETMQAPGIADWLRVFLSQPEARRKDFACGESFRVRQQIVDLAKFA